MQTKVKRARRAREPIRDPARVTVSSKRQITIPAGMARQLGIAAGGKLIARLKGGSIVLTPGPKDWLEYITGGPTGVYGRTKEEIDEYIRDVRKGWDRRARIAEGDSYVPTDDPRFDP